MQSFTLLPPSSPSSRFPTRCFLCRPQYGLYASAGTSVLPQEVNASMIPPVNIPPEALAAAFEDLPDAHTTIRLQDPFYLAWVSSRPSMLVPGQTY